MLDRKEFFTINSLHPSKVAQVSEFVRSLDNTHPLYRLASNILLSIKNANLEKYNKAFLDFKKEANLIKIAKVNREAVKELSPEFWVEFIKMSNRMGARPEDIAAVIMAESAFDPGAVAVRSGKVVAKGLNQITKVALSSIGMSLSIWNTMENMPAIDQLRWIEKYYKLAGVRGNIKKWDSPTELYIANFAPAHLKKAKDPNSILYKKYRNDGSLNPAYTMNIGLDKKSEKTKKRKGNITVGDLTRSVIAGVPKYVIEAIKTAKESISGKVESPKMEDIDVFINQLYTAAKADVLVVVKSASPVEDKIEFARVAAKILREFADADVSIHSSGNEVELQCSAVGSEEKVINAINALCECVAYKMKKSFGSEVRPLVFPSLISKHANLKAERIIRNRRKFVMTRIS